MIKKSTFILLAIVIVGMATRLYLAMGGHNFDITATEQDVQIFKEGKNIFIHQTAYNYSSFFFYLSGFFGWIQQIFPMLEIKFIVRAFYSVIDLLTLVVLVKIARKKNLSPNKTAALFFLNPISITISGHHAQFDNIAILFLLLGLLIYIQDNVTTKIKILKVWLLLTAGMYIKHIILNQVLLVFAYITKKPWQALLLFGTSLIVFLLSFLPFIEAGSKMFTQVFKYGGLQTFYGATYIISNICTDCTYYGMKAVDIYKYIFIAVYSSFSLYIGLRFKKYDVFRLVLLSMLFFLTFTSGIGAQYFVLPVAIGALFPTKWFYLYTGIVTLYFLGVSDEFGIIPFQVISWNVVWIFSSLWFLSELMSAMPRLRKLYNKIIS